MMDKIKSFLGFAAAPDYAEMVKNGAIILDVRSPGEYAGGHIKGSKNIPVSDLAKQMGKLDKTKTIITCCASGARSGVAKAMLAANGFPEVYNGGAWNSLEGKIAE
jgi:rhodanese-related sulfurtransferase